MRTPGKHEAWARLRQAITARPSRAQLLGGLLCGAVGFAAVTQVRLSQDDLLGQASRNLLPRLLLRCLMSAPALLFDRLDGYLGMC